MLSALQRIVVVVLCLLPTAVLALGLGAIEVSSGLYQPFDAKIPVIGAQPGQLANVNAKLAENDVFERARLARPHTLTTLQFLVVPSDDASGYIHVTSRDRIREPALEFIIEVRWHDGSLRRKYSVLLEPK